MCSCVVDYDSSHVDRGNTNEGDEKLMRTPRDTNVVASRKETTDVNQLKSELTNMDHVKFERLM